MTANEQQQALAGSATDETFSTAFAASFVMGDSTSSPTTERGMKHDTHCPEEPDEILKCTADAGAGLVMISVPFMPPPPALLTHTESCDVNLSIGQRTTSQSSDVRFFDPYVPLNCSSDSSRSAGLDGEINAGLSIPAPKALSNTFPTLAHASGVTQVDDAGQGSDLIASEDGALQLQRETTPEQLDFSKMNTEMYANRAPLVRSGPQALAFPLLEAKVVGSILPSPSLIAETKEHSSPPQVERRDANDGVEQSNRMPKRIDRSALSMFPDTATVPAISQVILNTTSANETLSEDASKSFSLVEVSDGKPFPQKTRDRLSSSDSHLLGDSAIPTAPLQRPTSVESATSSARDTESPPTKEESGNFRLDSQTVNTTWFASNHSLRQDTVPPLPAKSLGTSLPPQQTSVSPSGHDVLPTVNSAQLIRSLQSADMRIGLHSSEFGAISINTSLNRQLLSAQISTDHSELSKVLAIHLPSIEEKLGSSYGVHAKVEVHDGNIPTNSDPSRQQAGSQQGADHRQRNAQKPFSGLVNDHQQVTGRTLGRGPSTIGISAVNDVRLDIHI